MRMSARSFILTSTILCASGVSGQSASFEISSGEGAAGELVEITFRCTSTNAIAALDLGVPTPPGLSLPSLPILGSAITGPGAISPSFIDLSPTVGPNGEPGFHVGVITDFLLVNNLPANTDHELCVAEYLLDPGALPGETFNLVPQDGYTVLGGPPLINLVTDPLATEFNLFNGLLTFAQGTITVPGATFVRGDANTDGTVNIADAIRILNHLFPVPPAPTEIPCLASADTNDDGTLNIADAVQILDALFGSPPAAIPAPNTGTGCGIDPTPDLDCDAFDPC